MDDLEVPPGHTSRRIRRRLVRADAVAALAYVAGTVPVMVSSSWPVWLELTIVAGAGLPVSVRRLWPRRVLATVLAFSVAGLALGILVDPFLAASAVVYTVALTEPHRAWVPTRALGVLGAAVIVLAAIGGPEGWGWNRIASVLLGAALMGGTWALGRAVRERRIYAADAARQLARRAVTEERLRIARELHDVVAHSMSVITVKAGIANHVVREHPEEAADALGVIETTGRDTLYEMRRMLGVLRSPDGDDAHADFGPSPGLADLPALADRARMSGVVVDLRVDVDDAVPEGVELSAYRIAQEALTNVVRHAAPARCRLLVRTEGGAVTIDVTDDGPGARVLTPSPGGHGLIGMYERVCLYGGTFAAGPRTEGGFAVSARLPYLPVGQAAAPSAAGSEAPSAEPR